MRTDVDKLMAERGIDWLYIGGGNGDNPAMHYFLGDAQIGHCSLWKPQGGTATLLTGPFERDEAAKLPFNSLVTSELNLHELREIADPLERGVEMMRRVIDRLGVSGRLALYGRGGVGPSYKLWRAVDEALEGVDIEPEYANDLIVIARETKEPDEIKELKKAAVGACKTFSAIRQLLATAEVRQGKLYHDDAPLTVGLVKRRIALELFSNGLFEAVGSIFAPGRDGGFPHSTGADDHHLAVGEPIVYDMFPQQLGHGYFHDMTRTWCVGEPHQAAARDYELIKEVQQQVFDWIEVGKSCYGAHKLCAELLAAAGHPDIVSDPTTQTGFCHGLGHGVGLQVHESPRLGGTERNKDTFKPGSVFTLEPGVYYPDKGYGVRYEDTCYLDDDGVLHRLTDEPAAMLI
ncbi:MAG: M24 family metallopeptidase [Candidatus Coatesbacteria bacterium]|nr:M24 family metallopeptidase [Candidatus Coatesbacteria bacterium]